MKTPTKRAMCHAAAALATALAIGAACRVNAADIYWKGGSGGTEAEPKDLNSTDNWTTSSTYSGNSIQIPPSGNSHVFHFLVDALTYLADSNAGSGNAICGQWNFDGGDCVILGDIKTVGTVRIGNAASQSVGIVKPNGDWVIGDALAVGQNGTGVLEVNGGTIAAKRLIVGNNANSTGTLTINGGTVEITDSSQNLNLCVSSKSSGTINLNGGTLKTRRIYRNPAGTTGALNFNGGTLKANAVAPSTATGGLINDTTTVTVCGGGGVIDNGGLDIQIGAKNITGPGGLVFTGGGTTSFTTSSAIASTYYGVTSVAPGTTLVSYKNDAGKILARGLVLVGIPELNTPYTLMTAANDSNWDELAISAATVTCPAAAEYTVQCVKRSEGDTYNNTIVVTRTGGLNPAFWTGAKDNNLSDPDNWSDGVVPTGGNATISCASPATLVVGDTFAPSAITFAAGSAPVRIGGRDLVGIVAVTNLSSTSHTIDAKVYFAGNIQVKQDAMGGDADTDKPHVTFAGGAYAADGCAIENGAVDPTYSRCVFGEYFLANAAESPWTVTQSTGGNGHRRNSLAPDSMLHVPYAGNVGTIYIGTNATLVVGNQTVTNDRLSFRNYGEIVVSNLTWTGTGSADWYLTHGQTTANPGVFKFDCVTNSLSGKWLYFANANEVAAKHTVYIGKGGLNISDGTVGAYALGRNVANNLVTVRPWYSDFTISGRSDGKMSLVLWRDVTFCTDDEEGTGRTIAIDTPTRAGNPAAITVSGNGTLKVNKAASDNGAEPPVTLKDTATLEYTTTEATFGTGTVTLGDGTTFAFQNASRELTLPAPIALPATGSATLRIDGARLRAGDHIVIQSDVDADAADRLVVTGEAISGREASLRVDDGKLVLNIVPKGLITVVR